MLEAAKPQAAEAKRQSWILSEYGERGSSQAHVEQRPRTWIIKVSCVLITPSKRPGRSQEARETLRMMRLISRVFFAKECPFCRDGCSGPRFKHGSTQIKSFCISEIALLSLTRKNTADRRCRSSENQMFYLISDLLFFWIKIVDQQYWTIKLQL